MDAKRSNVELISGDPCPTCRRVATQRRKGGVYCKRCNTLYRVKIVVTGGIPLSDVTWAVRKITEKFIEKQVEKIHE